MENGLEMLPFANVSLQCNNNYRMVLCAIHFIAAVDCGDLDDPDNGRVDLSGTTFGSKAVYSCDRGYFLVGDSKRVCQANGEWSGDAPVCKRKSSV